MKKILYLLTFLAVLGCKEDLTIDQTTSLSEDDIKNFAVMHNNGLSSVLTNLSIANIHNIESNDQLESLLNSKLDQFYRESLTKTIDQQTAIKFSESEVNNYFKKGNQSQSRLDALNPIESLVEIYRDYLTDHQKEMLLEIDNVLTSEGANVEQIVIDLESIKEKTNSLSTEEAEIVLIGLEVGIASVDYWSKNLEEWVSVISPNFNQEARINDWFSWGNVAGSDVAGAVGGAVGAVVVNVVPGLGQVSYAGAIVGGGVGASAANAVKQVWDKATK